MDDNFLHALRRAPSQDFSEQLRSTLREQDSQALRRPLAPQAAKWTAFAASIALVAFAFTLPSVRAGAQAFLDLFRVVNFAGVSFDADRLSQLTTSGLDLPRMLGEQVETLEQAGAPASFETLAAASEAAGMTLRVPAWTPVGWQRVGIDVVGEQAARITASTAKLQSVLDALAIDDISIPDGLDGQSASVRIPPVVRMTYRNDTRSVNFLQALTPEVSFPAGLDLATLAEIGLRVLGLDRDDAYRFAQSIDWRTTLIVPVPTAAASFRQVDVLGQGGLMIEAADTSKGVLLWSSGDRVFALQGALRPQDLLEMAQTVQ